MNLQLAFGIKIPSHSLARDRRILGTWCLLQGVMLVILGPQQFFKYSVDAFVFSTVLLVYVSKRRPIPETHQMFSVQLSRPDNLDLVVLRPRGA